MLSWLLCNSSDYRSRLLGCLSVTTMSFDFLFISHFDRKSSFAVMSCTLCVYRPAVWRPWEVHWCQSLQQEESGDVHNHCGAVQLRCRVSEEGNKSVFF